MGRRGCDGVVLCVCVGEGGIWALGFGFGVVLRMDGKSACLHKLRSRLSIGSKE